jgi:hypothetical protein
MRRPLPPSAAKRADELVDTLQRLVLPAGTRQKRNYLFAGLASGPSTDSNTVSTKLASPLSGMK